MCTGRVDLAFPLRAFLDGADGVLIGACWPGECHYTTEGNYHALGNVHLCRKLLQHVGLDPERLRLEWVSASEGSRFAAAVDGFVARLAELGPLGAGEGIGEQDLRSRLESVSRLVPYIKLVERERLRIPVGTVQALSEFYASALAGRLFDELIAHSLAASRIVSLLSERPLTTSEISARTGMSPSEVAMHMERSSKRGLVRYDRDRGRYCLA